MLPGDRLICAFIENQTIGTQFQKWPLHLTIVPWFRLSDSSERLAKGLEKALTTVGTFEVTAEGESFFGPRKKRPVRLLQISGPLMQTEAKVRSYLHQKCAWLVDETTKKRYAFRPHVTMQGEKSLPPGYTFQIQRLYMVEQRGDYKEVAAVINL